MLLSTIALAAALQVSPAVEPQPFHVAPVAVPFAHAPRMAGQRSALECRQRATQARDDSSVSAAPLNRMPPAIGERAVMRMIDGCPVSTPIVQRAARR